MSVSEKGGALCLIHNQFVSDCLLAYRPVMCFDAQLFDAGLTKDRKGLVPPTRTIGAPKRAQVYILQNNSSNMKKIVLLRCH